MLFLLCSHFLVPWILEGKGNNFFFLQTHFQIRKDYYEEKVTPGPQSKILEGISWDEAQKAKVSIICTMKKIMGNVLVPLRLNTYKVQFQHNNFYYCYVISSA